MKGWTEKISRMEKIHLQITKSLGQNLDSGKMWSCTNKSLPIQILRKGKATGPAHLFTGIDWRLR